MKIKDKKLGREVEMEGTQRKSPHGGYFLSVFSLYDSHSVSSTPTKRIPGQVQLALLTNRLS